MAALLTAEHPQETIEEALGAQKERVIPELVRLANLRVKVPRYEVMLKKLAQRENTTIDDLLARHLLDMASAEREWLATMVPGFSEAIRWPER